MQLCMRYPPVAAARPASLEHLDTKFLNVLAYKGPISGLGARANVVAFLPARTTGVLVAISSSQGAGTLIRVFVNT